MTLATFYHLACNLEYAEFWWSFFPGNFLPIRFMSSLYRRPQICFGTSKHFLRTVANAAGGSYARRQARAARTEIDHAALARDYQYQCAQVTTFFDDPRNSAMVFQDAQSPSYSYNNMLSLLGNSQEGDPPTLSYASPLISSSIRMLAHYFAMSVLVEVNVERLFHQHEHGAATSYIFTNLRRLIDKTNLLDQLYEAIAPLCMEDTQPLSIKRLIRSLDSSAVDQFIANLPKDIYNFHSHQLYRQLFMNFKLGYYINYEDSDCKVGMRAENLSAFSSATVDDAALLKSFDLCFDQYKRALPSTTAHLNLLFSLCAALLRQSSCIPSYRIFGYLLDKLGAEGLFHYQSLIFLSIFRYEHAPTLLATHKSPSPPLAAFHFEHLVVEYPDIILSIFKYCASRGDTAMLERMFSFLRLQEVVAQNRVLSRLSIASILSKSRFTRQSSKLRFAEPLVFSTDDPLYVLVDTIHSCIEACIDLGLFQFIDLIMDKVVLHAVESRVEIGSPIRVALSFGNDISKTAALHSTDKEAPYVLMLAQGYSAREFARKLFGKRLFKLLLRACDEADDMGRLLWLMPHLDDYINHQLLECDPINCLHIENIKLYVADSTSVDDTFADQDASAPIDMELISLIFKTLLKFGMEAKLLDFNSILSFSQTIPPEDSIQSCNAT